MRGQGLTRAEREARPRSLRMGLNPGPSARSQPASNHRGRAAIRGAWIFHYGCIESRRLPVQSRPEPITNRLRPITIGSCPKQIVPRRVILRCCRADSTVHESQPTYAGPAKGLFLSLPWNNVETARLLLSLQNFSADGLLSRVWPVGMMAVLVAVP